MSCQEPLYRPWDEACGRHMPASFLSPCRQTNIVQTSGISPHDPHRHRAQMSDYRWVCPKIELSHPHSRYVVGQHSIPLSPRTLFDDRFLTDCLKTFEEKSACCVVYNLRLSVTIIRCRITYKGVKTVPAQGSWLVNDYMSAAREADVRWCCVKAHAIVNLIQIVTL